MEKPLRITVPVDIEVMDRAVELIGFKSRDEFVEVAVKRLLDRYRTLFKAANLRWSGGLKERLRRPA